MSFPPRGDEFYTQHPQEVYQGEWTNMKAQLGKSTGLALALLAALLATFLSNGCLLRGSSERTQRNQEFFPCFNYGCTWRHLSGYHRTL